MFQLRRNFAFQNLTFIRLSLKPTFSKFLWTMNSYTFFLEPDKDKSWRSLLVSNEPDKNSSFLGALGVHSCKLPLEWQSLGGIPVHLHSRAGSLGSQKDSLRITMELGFATVLWSPEVLAVTSCRAVPSPAVPSPGRQPVLWLGRLCRAALPGSPHC